VTWTETFHRAEMQIGLPRNSTANDELKITDENRNKKLSRNVFTQ